MIQLFLILFFPSVLLAFPENIRHGYISCTTCHVSPSGGGVLTPYGRAMSAELMSTWGSDKSAGFFFTDNENEEKNPPWFRGNAFLRGVQTRRNTPALERGQFIGMQADLETGIDMEKFAIVTSFGVRAKDPSQSKDLNQIFSRRHYALYRFNDNWALRAGKFMFGFGLNGPDHVTATRRGLNFDQGSESYNLEASYVGEKTTTLFTAIDETPSETFSRNEKAFAVDQAFAVGARSKIGLSVFSGATPTQDRFVTGPYVIWAPIKTVFVASEIFYQEKKSKVTSLSQKGYATFSRLNFEMTKGLVLFGQFDRSFLDTTAETSKFDSYGPGLQWFPYPHLEFLSYLGKEKAYNQEPTDFWWLMINVYL